MTEMSVVFLSWRLSVPSLSHHGELISTRIIGIVRQFN